MKVKVNVKCSCGFSTDVITKKPSHFAPTSDVCFCSGCGSKLQFLIKKAGASTKRKGDVMMHVRMVERSKVLQEIIAAEEAERLKEQQEVIKEVEGDRHNEAGV